MKNAIVTGANGFIGSAVVNELLQHGYRVYAIIHNGHQDRLQEYSLLKCISCNMENWDSLTDKLPKQKYDFIYHFAWLGSSGDARGDATLQIKNISIFLKLLFTAHIIGCPRVIGAGSIAERETLQDVYGENQILGFRNIYGGSKLASHIIGLSEAHKLGIELLWGMVTNTYGPGEISPRLINSTIQKCLNGISPKFTDGSQIYDFVYIDDVARAFRLIGEKGRSSQEYLIGSGHARPLKEFLLELEESIDTKVPFLFGEAPFIGIKLPIEAFDCKKTEQEIGFNANVPFLEGCKKTVAWWKERI